jgi:DNA-binding NarL/FixJ family response regulator
LLSQETCFEIIGEASDGLEAVELTRKWKPDVLLLDLRIQKMHGLEVLNQLRTQPHTNVLVVSMCSDDSSVIESLRNGSSGYVTKNCAPSELVRAIRAVAAGEQYICENIRSKALAATLKRFGPQSGDSHITKREFAVLELAAEGRTSADIAANLSISRRTAEAHRASIMKKLGLKTQTDLVLYAIRAGMITP